MSLESNIFLKSLLKFIKYSWCVLRIFSKFIDVLKVIEEKNSALKRSEIKDYVLRN